MELTLIFKMAGRDYGLEIDAVQEIIESPTIYPIPRGRNSLQGVLNIHGEVVPVIDLPALLDISDPHRDDRIIVLTPEFRSLALQVGRVGHILPLDLEPGVEASAATAAPYVRKGIARQGGDFVYLIDMDAVYERLERIFE